MKIIIIGASSGIGKTLALQYLEEGHHVGIMARRLPLLEEMQLLFPVTCFIQQFNVTGEEKIITASLQRMFNDLGGLDLLIYSSGFGEPSTLLDPEMEISTTRTNVNGFVNIAAFTFNYFVAQGYGQLAVISSLAGVRGGHWTPAYNASKAYVSNYAEGLNIKAYKTGKPIVITDIRPGFVNTKMAKGHGQFWVVDVKKAATQIRAAIAAKKRKVYISRRWRLVAWLLDVLPYGLYKRI